MKNVKKLPLIIFSATSLTVMTAIFIFSAQGGTDSSALSIKVTRVFARVIFFDWDSMPEQLQNMIVSELNGFIRKAAHFSVYALLGFNIYMAVSFLFNKLITKVTVSLSACLVYATADEMHQLYRPGRAGTFNDVALDFCGAVCGVTLAVIINSVIHYVRSSKA